MLPDMLFDRGVHLVGGVWVKDADKLLEILAAGGSRYHFRTNLIFSCFAAREKTDPPIMLFPTNLCQRG